MLPKFVFKIWQSFIAANPLKMQPLQAGFLMGLGDQLAQNFAENRPITRLDFGRTACFFGIGLFFVGPATKIWYRKLHRMFGSGGTYIALKKVAFDQIFFAPLFIAALVVIIGRTQRENWTEIKHKLQNDYPDIVKSNYKLWPAAQLINFYYVPLQYQVLFVQVIALAWNMYLSWRTHLKFNPEDLEQEFISLKK